MGDYTVTHISGYDNYEDVDEFKFSLECGREVEIRWKGTTYNMFKTGENDDEFMIMEAYNKDSARIFPSFDELLDSKLKTGEHLRDIITEVEVTDRNL